MVLNIACDLKTKEIVWVHNGSKVLSGSAVTWAALGRTNKLPS